MSVKTPLIKKERRYNKWSQFKNQPKRDDNSYAYCQNYQALLSPTIYKIALEFKHLKDKEETFISRVKILDITCQKLALKTLGGCYYAIRLKIT